jgi:hypothetical protein
LRSEKAYCPSAAEMGIVLAALFSLYQVILNLGNTTDVVDLLCFALPKKITKAYF